MITRGRAIEALRSERFDLVVIGGGISGAGVALAGELGWDRARIELAAARFAEEARAEGVATVP
jgi:glycerol-3-phosphate dehydrogenase